MKLPDLNYNYYFPYYTQSCVGEKKSFYKQNTIIHISEDRGILLSISYKRKKPSEVEVKELNDCQALFDYRNRGELIHYTAFAKEVKKVFKLFSSAIRQLSSESAYKKTLIFTTYIKHNENVELELDFRKIHVEFNKFDYVVVNGQIKRKENLLLETSELLKNLSLAAIVIDSQTKYVELDEKEFNEKLNSFWDYFIEYFKSPKSIKKKEYVL